MVGTNKNGGRGRFINEGECNWGRCTGTQLKDNKLLKLARSEEHQKCVERYNHWLQSDRRGETVLDMVNESHQATVLENRAYMKIIADILRLTAVQKYGATRAS